MLNELKKDLRNAVDPGRAANSTWFFKAGPGEYAEGDKFLGVTVPNQRLIARRYKDLPMPQIKKLITSPWHEERLTGLFILIALFDRSGDDVRKAIYDFYLGHTSHINNWDLVDSSAGYIIGQYLDSRAEKMDILRKLARSKLLWDRRIAMIATLAYITKGRPDEALEIAEILVNDKHDLIQKAVGWMLREVGKRCDRQLLEDFLFRHYKTMPRTMLRYSIEHFSPETRQRYLQGKA